MFLLGLLGLAALPRSGTSQEGSEEAFRRKIGAVAAHREETAEETCRVRNERLVALFREFVEARGGTATAEAVRTFTGWVARAGLTTFEHFLEAETTPVRTVRDPASGAAVTVLGALGSDLINPWLVTAGIVDGKPLAEQPMYGVATHALRAHTDFSIVGVPDPTLSFERIPAELRDRARAAYRRLNPTNVFDGGFDQPLFYSTLREMARKLFRDDYPRAKLDMAQLVVGEEKGGFGIRSCLLCHGRNHNDVYKRLLGQGLYYQNKLAERALPDAEAREAKEHSAVYLRAAQIVLEAHPDKIDAGRVRDSLALLAADNLERLKPGYDDFYGTLKTLGCVKCHGSDASCHPERNPVKYGAFVLNPSSYYKAENIKALSGVIDLENLDRSEILQKAAARVRHRGSKDLTLDEGGLAVLEAALRKWVHSFRPEGR
jgi:hypothetical protein